jgi:probable F420-dependent oxidoreductase
MTEQDETGQGNRATPDEAVMVIPPGKVVFGIQLPVQSQSTIYVEPWELEAGPAEMALAARQADESGFFFVGVSDHTAIPRRLASAMGTTWYDTVATLGWVAGLTSRVRLLAYVYIAPLRHPLRAAKEFATLDRLSDGRLIVGVGAGHVPEEFSLMGREFEERGSLTDEAIDGIIAGLLDEFPELSGPRWAVRDLGISPRPVQRPRPPIWVGGSSPAALRRAATRGDGWLPQTPKRKDMPGNIEKLLEVRSKVRNGAPIAVGALGGTFHVGEPAWELSRGAVAGGPEQIADNLSELVQMGVSHIHVRFPSRSAAELCDQIAAFGEQVIPLFA